MNQILAASLLAISLFIREMIQVAKAGAKIIIVDERIKLMEALTWLLDIRQLLGAYLDLEP